jgi:hypothetical protein
LTVQEPGMSADSWDGPPPRCAALRDPVGEVHDGADQLGAVE